MLCAWIILKPSTLSSPWKNCLFVKLVPGVKKVGDCCPRAEVLNSGFLLKSPGRVCVWGVCVFTMRCLGHILKPLHQAMWGQEIHIFKNFFRWFQGATKTINSWLRGETAKIKLLLFALSPNIRLFLWIFILTLLPNQTWVHLPSVQQSLLTGEESSGFICNVPRSMGSSSTKGLNFLMTFREGFYFIYKTFWCGLFWGTYWICDSIASILRFSLLALRHVGS